jgi:two-component sensor histidine kinase
MRRRAEEHQRSLNAELDHRIKNLLATVSAIINRTHEGSRSLADFVAALDGRIRAMAATHELLSLSHWHGVSLAVRRELEPYFADNIEVGGPSVTLKAEAAQILAMVLHELVTNAAKYGALSTRSGRASIRWFLTLNGNVRDRLTIEWQERGGPLVRASSQSGYGMSVIRELIPYEFGGTVDYKLTPEGVRCQLNIPVAQLNGVEIS